MRELPALLVKRTRCYVMRPKEYEISGCPCGNTDPDWSEYVGHVWCHVCERDFKPECDGIFSGPIPVNGTALMGIDIRQYDLLSGEVFPVEDHKL